MTENDAERIRDAIARDQHWTLCYCSARTGALPRTVQLCADCVGWLVENSSRIEAGWRWYVNCVAIAKTHAVAGTSFADAAEADDRAYFGL